MKKLDLILENIRDEYMINVLEEGTVTELETLKTKKFLNENLQRVRTMLVEEGALEGVKDHLANNWGKYLAGGATAALMASDPVQTGIQDAAQGLGAVVGNDNLTPGEQVVGAGQVIGSTVGDAAEDVAGELAQFGDKLVDKAGNIYDQAGQLLGNIADQASQAGQAVSSTVAGGAQA